MSWFAPLLPSLGVAAPSALTWQSLAFCILYYNYTTRRVGRGGNVAAWVEGRDRAAIGKEETCSGYMQQQSLAHHAHRVLVQPVQVGLLAQPKRRTRPGSLLRQPFYTTLVEKSQQANGASELLRTLRPPTRDHRCREKGRRPGPVRPGYTGCPACSLTRSNSRLACQ